ncbi:MAG TPA: hypothetical protein VJX72_14590 [Candidatus Acidoferrum sp.]|nr:hypothetical protein [Candidatus Acidoferrum sp.]
MKPDSVGEIIAERTYRLLRDGHQAESVVVQLGKPVHFSNCTDFYCPYQITRPNSVKIMGIGGLDAFQALQLAINTLGVELEVIRRDSGGQLIWEGDEEGNLGFPIPEKE